MNETRATLDGLNALLSSPLSGGMQSNEVGAVNLVASIAASVCHSPLRLHLRSSPRLAGRWKVLAPIATVVFITLLTSQPALDSTAVFLLIANRRCPIQEPERRRCPGGSDSVPLRQTHTGNDE